MSGCTDEPRLDVPVSKIKVTRNAKGQAQWEITVIPGATRSEMDALRAIAVEQWNALENELPDTP